MTITALSSRELDQDVCRAMKAAQNRPVFITNSGHPTHVLLTMQEYQHLLSGQLTLIEALAQPDAADFDFDPPSLKGLYRSADWRIIPSLLK
jgi:PHD/YefM family antitoxin component YafN of YafNO toxin-antitoxin module